jgi:CBS domain-containing protein/ribosome-associated translation inhibitor RaiA
MKISDIMTDDVITLSSDDTMAKALSIMYKKRINQIPIIDKYEKYQGMVFAKDFLNVSATTSSKLKNYVVKTPVLNPTDNIKRSTQLIVTTGNRALPVVEDSKLIGIISETDVIRKTHFGNTPVDSVMASAIIIEDDTPLDTALAKMRRYNISRLPVIDSKGDLMGVINALDRAKIMATPKERISKDSRISSQKAAVRLVKVRDIMRKTIPVRLGTKLKDIVEAFTEHEEIIVIGDKRKPIGIITPRDALEIILPRQDRPNIDIANASDNEIRSTIEEHMKRFLNKIHGKHETVQSLIVYADKYKTRKYSLRAKIIFSSHVIGAKAVGYDPLSASKKLIAVLDRRMKSERGKKSRYRQQSSIRHL